MKIAIIGTRRYSPEAADIVRRIVASLAKDDVVVTGCAEGVDAYVCQTARTAGHVVVECHAPWPKHGRAAGPLRNAVIAEVADRCVAIPDAGSVGTWDCVKRFKALGKQVEVVKVESVTAR